MLQSIRDKATGWLAYVVIGLIAIPFALWGIGEYFGGAGPLVAAEVNKQEIPVRVVQQETRAQREQLARMFGGRIPPDVFDERELRSAALESLIQRELLRQAADKAGFRASAAGVVREIREFPAFIEDGRFSPERYLAVLEAQRISPGDFERDIAQSMVLAQVRGAISASGDLPAVKAAEYAQLRNQVRVASWRVFPALDYERPEVVSDATVEAFHRENPELFTAPERLQVSYVLLDPAALETGLDVSEADVREHYEVNAQRYAEPELRRVRQILIAREGADSEQRSRELRARIDGGEDFATLAEQFSEDPLSAERGGNMGQIARGDMDPVLETVVFSLPVGLISQPVQTRRGWHILEVTEIQPSRAKPFDEVREEVARDLRDRRAEQRQIQILDDLLTQAVENPASLGAAARMTGLPIETSGWFTRDRGEGIAQNRAVREAAFSHRVRIDGLNSPAVDLPDGSTVVLRLHQRQEPVVKPVEEVAAEIREILKRDAAAQAARLDGETLLGSLEAGRAVVDLHEQDPEGWVLGVPVHRVYGPEADVVVPEALLEHLFRMRAPQAAAPRIEGLVLPGGDYAVIVLESVETIALEQAPEDVRVAGEAMRAEYAGAELQAYLVWLESQAKVRRYPENFE